MNPRVVTIAGRTIFMILATALVLGNWASIDRAPISPAEPGPVDQVLGSKPVLLSLRIGIIALMTYLVSSVVALALQGRWLIKLGPRGAEAQASTDELIYSNRELLERIDDLEAAADDAWEAIARIEAELEDEREGDLE